MSAGPSPTQRRDPARKAELAALVFDLRLQGLTFRAIDILTQAPDGPTGGHRVSATSAKELVYAEAARRVDPRVDLWRAVCLERLDGIVKDYLAIRNAHWGRAIGDEDHKPEASAALAVDRALTGVGRTVEQQAKLVGAHITKIDATVTEVTQQDIELQELIRNAKAKVQLEEKAIVEGEAGDG